DFHVNGVQTCALPIFLIPDAIDPSKVGEDALDHALPWDSINAVPHTRLHDIGLVVGDLNLRHNKRFDKDPEFKLLLEEIELVEKIGRASCRERVSREA